MEIKNYKEINSGCLKATMVIFIPEWGEQEVDCTYFEKDNGSFWFNFAAREYTTREGQKKTWNQVRWPQHVKERLTKAIQQKIKANQVQYIVMPERKPAAPVNEPAPEWLNEEVPF